MISKRTLLTVCAVLAVPVTQLMADVVAPIGLAPGSQYQLIFVTADTITGTSANVFDYDTFAAHEAGQSALPSAAWSAVVSTPTTNAIVTAPSDGLPIYNTAGQLVAASTLYDGSAVAPVGYDQFGNLEGGPFALVWTGSDSLGVAGAGGGPPNPEWALGNGYQDPSGNAGSPNGVGSELLSNGDAQLADTLPIYALSSPITLPSPEPSSLVLVVVGGVSLITRRRRA